MKLNVDQQNKLNKQICKIKFWKLIGGKYGIYVISLISFGILLLMLLLLGGINCCFSHGWRNLDDYFFALFKISAPVDLFGSHVYHIITYVIMGMAATFLVPILTAAIAHWKDRKISRLLEGRMVYENMYDHHVLIGYNHFAPEIIKTLLEHNNQYLIILTEKSPFTLRTELQNILPPEMFTRVIIYAGDAVSIDTVKNLNLAFANEVYLLDESDYLGSQYTRNVSVLKNIVNTVVNRQEPLPVYMQVNNNKAYNLLQRVDIPQEFFKNEEGRMVIDYRPFNFYENWARLLWSYHVLRDVNGEPVYEPLDFEPLENTNKHVHLVISGSNSMGRALFLEALRLCHYPNFDEGTKDNKTVITVVDAKWNDKKDDFFAQYPYLDQIADIDIQYMDVDITHPKVREMIAKWAQDENELLTIAICEKDPDTALTKALNLPEDVYNNRTRILVRQEIKDSLDEVFAHSKDSYPHIQLFGMFKNTCEESLYDDYLAICANVVYQAVSNEDENHKSRKIDIQDEEFEKIFKEKFRNAFKSLAEERDIWRNLIESKKWSNRYQVDMYGYYISVLARHRDLDVKQKALLYEQLAEVEHHRWCAERIISGWHQAEDGVTRNNARRIHNLIVPYSELSDDRKDGRKLAYERNKDYNVIATLQLLLEVAKESEKEAKP